MIKEGKIREEEKRLKSEPKPDPDDSEYSEEDEDNLSVHDNDSFPFWYKRRDGTLYTNKAWKDREAKILDYKNRSSKLSDNTKQVYDAIHCPPGCAGGVVPLDLSDDVLRTLKPLCIAALKIYNQTNIKQGPTFVFDKVVKCTHPGATSLYAPRVYYITFKAKAEAIQKKGGRPALTTFQTHVSQRKDKDPVVKECFIKKI
ncbi:hypothetical protein MTR_8g461300 [Medicago truncatula]|uniref:Uncharacterized protein n=1 Tax=Medicago truncatula TaxID=3880 RepID=A0A072TQ21_MEDTR|nr:hypothetical protein MTR_8g461300 [Medicago truncatula]